MGWIEGRAPASDGAIAAAKLASSPPKRERRESIFVDPFGRASAIKEMLGTAASIIFGAPLRRGRAQILAEQEGRRGKEARRNEAR